MSFLDSSRALLRPSFGVRRALVRPGHWWRTVFFLIPAISIYTILLGTLSIGSTLFGGRGDVAHRCARLWSWLILATTGVQVHVSGMERLRPDTAYVFVSNHQSIYDIPIVFASLAFQLRIIAKHSLGNIPFLGWHLRRSRHILVDRTKPGATLFKPVSTLMQQGRSLLVFPEGTRSADGRVGRFKGGIFLLTIEAGRPIVPLAVVGSRHVMLRGRLMTCPGQVGLLVHEPMATAGLSRTDAKLLAARVQRIIQGSVETRPATESVAAGSPPSSVAINRQSLVDCR